MRPISPAGSKHSSSSIFVTASLIPAFVINTTYQGAVTYASLNGIAFKPQSLQPQPGKFLDAADKVVTRITTWGTQDGASWLNGGFGRRRTNYPLLFDRDLKPKPAFKAVLDALAAP